MHFILTLSLSFVLLHFSKKLKNLVFQKFYWSFSVSFDFQEKRKKKIDMPFLIYGTPFTFLSIKDYAFSMERV